MPSRAPFLFSLTFIVVRSKLRYPYSARVSAYIYVRYPSLITAYTHLIWGHNWGIG